MNARHALLLGAIGAAAFALGAWLGGRGHSLTTRPAAAAPATMPGIGEHATAARETMDEIVGAIISQASEPDPLKRLRRLREELDRIPEKEVVVMLDRLDHLPRQERDALLAPVFARLCILHPEAASAWVRGLPKSASSSLFVAGSADYWAIFMAWQRFLPAAALAEANNFPEQFGQIYAYRMSEASGPNRSRDSLLALEGIPPGRLREKAVMRYISMFATSDPATAMQLAEAELTPEARNKALLAAFETYSGLFTGSDEQLAALKTVMDDKPAGVWGHTRADYLLADAAKRSDDPRRIAEWTLSLADGARTPAAIEVVTEWSKRNGLDALDWAWKNGVPVDIWNSDLSYRKGPQAEAPLIFAARKQPEKVAAWLAALPPGPERERLITYALHNPAEKFHATLRAALGR